MNSVNYSQDKMDGPVSASIVVSLYWKSNMSEGFCISVVYVSMCLQ